MWNSEATPRLQHLELRTLEFLFLVDSRVSISLGRILGGFECAKIVFMKDIIPEESVLSWLSFTLASRRCIFLSARTRAALPATTRRDGRTFFLFGAGVGPDTDKTAKQQNTLPSR